MKSHVLCHITFFRKTHRSWDNVEKYGGYRKAKNDVTIWRIRFAYWISKVICTRPRPRVPICKHAHTDQYVISYWLLFHSNNGFVNEPQCYVIRTLSVLLSSNLADLLQWYPLVCLSGFKIAIFYAPCYSLWVYSCSHQRCCSFSPPLHTQAA